MKTTEDTRDPQVSHPKTQELSMREEPLEELVSASFKQSVDGYAEDGVQYIELAEAERLFRSLFRHFSTLKSADL